MTTLKEQLTKYNTYNNKQEAMSNCQLATANWQLHTEDVKKNQRIKFNKLCGQIALVLQDFCKRNIINTINLSVIYSCDEFI